MHGVLTSCPHNQLKKNDSKREILMEKRDGLNNNKKERIVEVNSKQNWDINIQHRRKRQEYRNNKNERAKKRKHYFYSKRCSSVCRYTKQKQWEDCVVFDKRGAWNICLFVRDENRVIYGCKLREREKTELLSDFAVFTVSMITALINVPLSTPSYQSSKRVTLFSSTHTPFVNNPFFSPVFHQLRFKAIFFILYRLNTPLGELDDDTFDKGREIVNVRISKARLRQHLTWLLFFSMINCRKSILLTYYFKLTKIHKILIETLQKPHFLLKNS